MRIVRTRDYEDDKQESCKRHLCTNYSEAKLRPGHKSVPPLVRMPSLLIGKQRADLDFAGFYVQPDEYRGLSQR